MGKLVLVIDDDKPLTELLVDILEGEGYRIVVAHDGRDGLVQARQVRPDLVLCDIMLPYLVLPVYAALRGIDPAHLRAARGLGASEVLTLRKVVLPALRGGSLAGAVIVFVMSLGFYVTPAFKRELKRRLERGGRLLGHGVGYLVQR